MLSWLIGVVIGLLLWSMLWRSQPKAGFGVLLGLIVAWFLSLPLRPYIIGMQEIPLWLPPLPLAVIAITLFAFGAIVWFRADRLPPPRRGDSHDEHGSAPPH